MISIQRQLWHNPSSCQGKIFEKIEYRCLDLTAAQKSMLQLFISFAKKYPHLYPSQQYIARRLKLHVSTVGDGLARLAKFGFIEKAERSYQTCMYRVAPFFLNTVNFKRIAYIFDKTRVLFSNAFLISKPITTRKKPNPLASSYSKFNISFSYFTSSLYSYFTLLRNKRIYNVESMGARGREISRAEFTSHVKLAMKKESGFGVKKRERGKMNELIICEALRTLTDRCKLTKWAQLKLQAFPEEALEYGVKTLQGKSDIKSPFSFLMSVLKSYCEQKNLEINWRKFYHLAGVYNMPDDAPMTLIPEQPVTDRHEFGTKRHDLESQPTYPNSFPHKAIHPLKRNDPIIRTVAPKENPHDVIDRYEQWVASPQFEKESRICGKVIPQILIIILEKRVSETEIVRLYGKYHFMQAAVEHARDLRRKAKMPPPDPVVEREDRGIMENVMEQMVQRSIA